MIKIAKVLIRIRELEGKRGNDIEFDSTNTMPRLNRPIGPCNTMIVPT